MNRRSFIGRVSLAVVALCMPVFLTGCNALTDLLNWIPVGLSAVNAILKLLTGAAIFLPAGVNAIIGLIQTGLTDLTLAIKQYQSTDPPPQGVLAQIDTFLSDLVSNIANVIAQLPQQPANDINLVVGLFELLLTTLQGFIAQVPQASASLVKTKLMLNRGLMVGGRGVSIVPRKNLSRRGYIHDHNALAKAGGHPETMLPESLIQHL